MENMSVHDIVFLWKKRALEDIQSFAQHGTVIRRPEPKSSASSNNCFCFVPSHNDMDKDPYKAYKENGLNSTTIPRQDIITVLDAFFAVFESKYVREWSTPMLDWLEAQLRLLELWPSDFPRELFTAFRARPMAYGFVDRIAWRDIYMDGVQWRFQ